jgi:hypothetical protein
MGSLSVKNASKKFSRLGTFKGKFTGLKDKNGNKVVLKIL